VVLPLLLDQGHRRIEALVITHEHADHAGGALALLEALEVGELWLGPRARDSALGRLVADTAAQRGAALGLAVAGMRIRRAGLPIRLLAPRRNVRFADPNERSVVAIVGRRPHRLLVPGDVEDAGEVALLESGHDLVAEALVLPHHGSRQAASAPLLIRVRARIALVSAGRDNPFGHPSPDTLARARATGAIVLRTDVSGLLRLEAGERGWVVRAP
jgi:competence protein ComEC